MLKVKGGHWLFPQLNTASGHSPLSIVRALTDVAYSKMVSVCLELGADRSYHYLVLWAPGAPEITMRAGVGLEVAEGLHLTGHFLKCVLAAPAFAAVVGVRFCAGIVAHPVDLWALNCAALLVTQVINGVAGLGQTSVQQKSHGQTVGQKRQKLTNPVGAGPIPGGGAVQPSCCAETRNNIHS